MRTAPWACLARRPVSKVSGRPLTVTDSRTKDMANERSLGAGCAAVARLGAECFAQAFGPRFVRAIPNASETGVRGGGSGGGRSRAGIEEQGVRRSSRRVDVWTERCGAEGSLRFCRCPLFA